MSKSTDVATQKNAMVIYSHSDEALAELVSASADLTTAEDSESYEAVRKAIAPLRDTRVAIEKERKAKKADVLAMGRTIDGEAKRLTAIISGEESRLKALKQAVDDKAARVEAERVQAIKDRIAEIGAMDQGALDALVAGDDLAKFAEFEGDAMQAISDRSKEIQSEREAAAERERIAAEQAELEAQRKAQAEAEAKARAEQEAAEARLCAEREALEAEKRAADEAARKEREAIEAERAKVEAEKERQRMEQEAKEQAARELAEQQKAEADRKARAQAALPDADKMLAFAEAIQAVPSPSLKNAAASKALAKALESIDSAAEELRRFARRVREAA